MPRATRSGRVPQAPVKYSVPPRQPLQTKSTNALKRPLENASAKPSKKRSNVPFTESRVGGFDTALLTSSKSISGRQPGNTPPCVYGHYTMSIFQCDSFREVDTSGFTLTLYQPQAPGETQVYATFKFGDLEGIMRFLPTATLADENNPEWTLGIEKACNLEKEDLPSPDNDRWQMIWRAKEGGLRLNKLVGTDKDNHPCELSFIYDLSSPENPFGLKLRFMLWYNQTVYNITGTKVKNLDERLEAGTPWSLRHRWYNLDPVRDVNSDLRSALEGESDSGSRTADLIENQEREIASLKKLLVKARRQIYELQNRGKTAVASTKSSSDQKGSKRPEPRVEWDVSGVYQLTSMSKDQTLDTSSCEMIIHYRNWGQQQLYAKFKFGELKGLMRFCPATVLDLEFPEKPLLTEEFDAACHLEDQPPGPENARWLMRWRGKEGDNIFGGQTRAQTGFSFESNPSSSFASSFGMSPGFKVVFVMYHKGKPLMFKGIKTAHCPEPVDLDLEHEWKSLFIEE